MNLIRPALYAGCALAGVYLVAQLRPVALDANAAIGASGLDFGELASDLFGGRWGEVRSGLTGAGGKAAGNAQAQVQAQVQSIVVTGVVGGCVVAALIDGLVLS